VLITEAWKERGTVSGFNVPRCAATASISTRRGQTAFTDSRLGGSWRSWNPVLDALAAQREVIAVDLPGHGATPPLQGEVSIRTLADALTDYLAANDLTGIDAVGSSMGARLVLELARRGGVLGAVVSLDPGGFWRGWEIPHFTTRLRFRFGSCAPCSRRCRYYSQRREPLGFAGAVFCASVETAAATRAR
jgi:pimeloyl-ACP methyl ester carboxylesterase